MIVAAIGLLNFVGGFATNAPRGWVSVAVIADVLIVAALLLVWAVAPSIG